MASRGEKASRGKGRGNGPQAGRVANVRVELFDPEQVRPWRFHNRRGSGMDEESLEALALSIRRDGQQQLGLARRLPPGDSHLVEAVFGIRRLEACRRAGLPWRAEVRDASVSDAECASLMHGENEWTEGVSPLENAIQWKAMLDAGVFKNQSALADSLGCHRGRVSRAVRNATVLFGEDWLARLVRPVLHEFSGRSADRLAEACADPVRKAAAQRRGEGLHPGQVAADSLYKALFERGDPTSAGRQTVYQLRKGGASTGLVTAKIERDASGAVSVRVKPAEQTPAELAETAERIEEMLASIAGSAAGVRLGRRLIALLSPEEAKDAPRSWLEGCVWTAARASGLAWDRWQAAAVAEVLRTQSQGWEHAVVRAVGGADADPAGRGSPHTEGPGA